MRLKELLEEDLYYIIIELPSELIPNDVLINEGKWVNSGKMGWMARVDAGNPSINSQRHVHVAPKQSITNKNRQASWNQDGTRHDRKTFNDKIGNLRIAQVIARKALNLPDHVILEENNLFLENLRAYCPSSYLFGLTVRKVTVK